MSLIEVTVVLLLMVLVSGIIYELIIATTRASMFVESRNDIATIGQRAVNAIHTEAIQSKLVFQEDSLGSGYRTLFVNALPSGVAVWANSRMPIIDGGTSAIGPDPGPNNIPNRTGNSLIVVRELQPVPIPYDHDNNGGTPNINFMADRYQFEYYFLRQNTAQSFTGSGYYIDLMQAKSQVFADYFQLSSITVNQGQLVQALRTQSPPMLMAWDPGKTIGTPAFYTLNATGTLAGNASPVFNLTLSSLLSEFTGGRISGKMIYSVGLNASALPSIQDPVPLYAAANSNFPGGLEFLIVGPSGSRKLVSRLVLVSESLGKFVSRESSVTTSARGF